MCKKNTCDVLKECCIFGWLVEDKIQVDWDSKEVVDILLFRVWLQYWLYYGKYHLDTCRPEFYYGMVLESL